MGENILFDDFEYLLNSELNLQKLKNKTILITGATGLVGSYLIRFLLYCNKKENINVNILGVVRNIQKANEIFECYDTSNLKLIVSDLAKINIIIEESIDYIVHAAAVTTSKMLVEEPVDALKIAINGTQTILDLARKKNTLATVYLSSMEVYGQPSSNGLVTENKLGSVNLSNIRSGYPETKRMCEFMCNAYAEQYGMNVKIARLAQTFGAGILPNESRVFAQFAKNVIDNKDIILHTAGKSEGNYVYIADAVKAILLLLFNGAKGQPYNVVNENTHMTIKEMAKLVLTNFGSKKQKLIIDIPSEDMGYAPDVHMRLSGEKIKKIGWQPYYDLADSYARLIDWLKSPLKY